MTAAIALGSNLSSPWGDPSANLHEALRRLRALGEVVAVSTFRQTAPVGYVDQPTFTNAAALLETMLGPHPLLHALLAIERSMGRDRVSIPPKGPRVLDLDLLLYVGNGDSGSPAGSPAGFQAGSQADSKVLHDPDLILPHPALHQRRFVLEPLAEIAPELVHPTLHRTIAELLASLPTVA